MNNFDYLKKCLQDPYLDTWHSTEPKRINALGKVQGIHYFAYDSYTSLITRLPSKLEDEPITHQDDHLVIYQSDGTLPLD